MIHRLAPTLLTFLVGAGAAALVAQSPEPKAAFVQAVGQFSLALDGAYGDEGAGVKAGLEAMSRALDQWDGLLRKYEAAMAADLPAAEPALATRMHLALAGLYFDRTRTADGLRELGAARQRDQTRADLPMFEALAQMQLTGNDAAATAALRRASTLDPNDSIAAYLLARNLSRTAATEEANRAYERFTALVRLPSTPLGPGKPDTPETGRPVQQSQAPSTPFVDLRLFHETPGVEPFFPPAPYIDGFTELQRGNLAGAIAAFRQSVMRDPLVADAGVESGALARAAAAFRDGSLDRAAEHLAVAIELAPERSEPRRLLGLVHYADRRLDAAVEALTEAIRLNPRDERTRLALADVLVESDELTRARDALQETLKLDPASGRARYKLGLVYQRQGLYADAIRELTAAIASKPLLGLNSLYQTLGALARSQQQYDAAIAAFSARIDLVPNDAGAHHELGQMYFRQGRHIEALAEFTVAVMLNPKHTDSHAALAQVHLRSGNHAEAAAAARRAVSMDAAHREARYVLATALVRMGNVDEGKRELEVYQRLQSEATAAQSRQLEIEGFRRDASLSIVNGEFAKAVALLRQALERDPESARSHLDLGIALLKAGQSAEAVERLTAAAARENNEDAHEYLSEAYAALGRREDADRERAVVARMRQEALRRAGERR
jgi:tetratricopeptide (TPR) repeat protein